MKNYLKILHNVKTQNLLHHLCNAYESFYTSGFDRAAILVADGFGVNESYGITEDVLFDLMFDVKNKDLTEYMLRAIPIRKEMRDKVFACTHIDGTTRPQRLRREVNPEFYDMIMEFYKKTGVPCVVNTSLNGRGEPIVESLDALMDFLETHLEVEGVVLNGKFLIYNIYNNITT